MASVIGSLGQRMFKLALRARVALAYTALGFVLSLLFATATVFIAEDYEHVVVEQILLGQAQALGIGTGADAVSPLLSRTPMRSYVSGKAGHGDVPPYLRGLALGTHEVYDESGNEVHVGVFDAPEGRVYLSIGLENIEELEVHLNWILLVIVLAGSAISCWLGWTWAGRTVAPVVKLAAAVESLPVRPIRTQLHSGFGSDEVGRLAQAIDQYQSRLVEAKEHELAFFADASHELRTPIAVVRGVTEVLLDDPDADPVQSKRLRRLERGMLDLTEQTETLFVLARQKLDAPEAIDLRAALLECLDACRKFFPHLSEAELSVGAGQTLFAPRQQSMLVLRSLLRRVVVPDTSGRLSIRFEFNTLEIRFGSGPPASSEMATAAKPARSDLKLGISLTGRLAAAMGWRVDGSFDTSDRVIEIVFPPS